MLKSLLEWVKLAPIMQLIPHTTLHLQMWFDITSVTFYTISMHFNINSLFHAILQMLGVFQHLQIFSYAKQYDD